MVAKSKTTPCRVHAPELIPHLTGAISKANATNDWKANFCTREQHRDPRGGFSRSAASAGVVADEALIGTIAAIAEASAVVAVELRHSIVEKKAHENEFGDSVLSVDLIADAAIARHLKASPYVATFASEEHPILVESDAYLTVKKEFPTGLTLSASVNNGTKTASSSPSSSSASASASASAPPPPPPLLPQTCVTFDPLDGSSIMDTNFSVGTIYAVWKGATPIGQRAGDMAASVVVVYGPRCVMYVAEPRIGVFGYMLYDDRHWHLLQTRPFVVAPKAKIFSPGNLRAMAEHRGYRKFIQSLVLERGLTLRYTGGMVPDTMQMLNKGSGLFTTPIAPSHKVKLRVCFECAPIAFMVHCAGGWSVCDTVATREPKFTCTVGAAAPPPAKSAPSASGETDATKRGGLAATASAVGGAPSGGSYMDVAVKAIDQRSAIGVGSASDVVAYWRALKANEPPVSSADKAKSSAESKL